MHHRSVTSKRLPHGKSPLHLQHSYQHSSPDRQPFTPLQLNHQHSSSAELTADSKLLLQQPSEPSQLPQVSNSQFLAKQEIYDDFNQGRHIRTKSASHQGGSAAANMTSDADSDALVCSDTFDSAAAEARHHSHSADSLMSQRSHPVASVAAEACEPAATATRSPSLSAVVQRLQSSATAAVLQSPPASSAETMYPTATGRMHEAQLQHQALDRETKHHHAALASYVSQNHGDFLSATPSPMQPGLRRPPQAVRTQTQQLLEILRREQAGVESSRLQNLPAGIPLTPMVANDVLPRDSLEASIWRLANGRNQFS